MSSLVSIHSTLKKARIPRAKLNSLADIILSSRGRKKNVNLVFIADEKMRSLNRDFRGRDRTTDVLSFNLEDDDDPLLGEIYISLPQARRNAEKYGVTVTAETLRLFAHGLLHLCGVHHPDPKATDKMNELVDEYISRLQAREDG